MVHLELTHSLNTNELNFLQAFGRMRSRRDHCHTMWSDNARTFKAANREIPKLYAEPITESQKMWNLDQDQIRSEFSSLGITWKFITKRFPWRDGWWERFLQSDQRTTLLVRIEGIINSRPLTEVTDYCKDPLPVTSAHLAIGRPITQLPNYRSRKKVTWRSPVRELSKSISSCRDCSITTGSVARKSTYISCPEETSGIKGPLQFE